MLDSAWCVSSPTCQQLELDERVEDLILVVVGRSREHAPAKGAHPLQDLSKIAARLLKCVQIDVPI